MQKTRLFVVSFCPIFIAITLIRSTARVIQKTPALSALQLPVQSFVDYYL